MVFSVNDEKIIFIAICLSIFTMIFIFMIKKICCFRYSRLSKIDSNTTLLSESSNNDTDDDYEEYEKCSICLKHIKKNTSVLSCGHQYHKKCINKWKNINNQCPICREKINKIYQNI